MKQMIWNEIGQGQFEREKELLDLEQECLEVYRRKVDAANTSRARLHQELAEAEAEFTHLLLSLGERSLPGRVTLLIKTLSTQYISVTRYNSMQVKLDPNTYVHSNFAKL